MSLVQGLMDIIRQEMSSRGLTKLHKVVVVAGALAGVVPEAMETGWEILSRETDLDGGELVMQEVPTVLKCVACGREFEATDRFISPCPDCGEDFGHAVKSGRELYIASIEAE